MSLTRMDTPRAARAARAAPDHAVPAALALQSAVGNRAFGRLLRTHQLLRTPTDTTRNRYPKFTRPNPSELALVESQVKTLSDQTGLKIRADQVLEAPWIGSSEMSTSEGWLRYPGSFWRAYAEVAPREAALLKAGHIVTPEYAEAMGWPDSTVGQPLEHHHIANSRFVVPLPANAHTAEVHRTPTVVGTPKKPATQVEPLLEPTNPAAAPASAAGGEPAALADAAVDAYAQERGLVRSSQGGFATVDGMLFTGAVLGTTFLIIAGIRAHGVAQTARDFVIGTAMFKGITALTGVEFGFYSGLAFGVLLNMPNDQGVRYQREATEHDLTMRLVNTLYPDVVRDVGNEYCMIGLGWPCVQVNDPWEVADYKRFGVMYPEFAKVVRNPYRLEREPPRVLRNRYDK